MVVSLDDSNAPQKMTHSYKQLDEHLVTPESTQFTIRRPIIKLKQWMQRMVTNEAKEFWKG